MKMLPLTLAAALLAPPAGAAEARKTDAEVVAGLGPHLKSLAEAGQFSGAVVLAKGDRVLFREAYGLASRETGAANTPETKFNLGSINKAFTRMAIERLAAEGKLALSDTLDKYVPEFPAEAARRITLAQLLEHRAGTGDFFGPRYDAYDHARLRTLRDWLPLFVDAPLEFEPGTRQRYSNAGYLLLGLAIEKVTGRPYHDYVRETIFAPAGMKDTDAYPVDADVPNRAVGYTARGEKPGDNRRSLPWRGSSAGGGYSTVDDLKRFADALRAGRFGGRPGGGLSIAGGAPGVNAVLEMEGDYTIAVMANLDPLAAQEVARTIRGWLGIAVEDGPGRRIVRAGGDGPDPLGAAARTLVPDAGAEAAMARSGHMPAVQVMVNGQGPFLFAIDTGGGGTARIDGALAARLGLPKAGEVLGGDPSGRNPRPMEVVAIDSLSIGPVRFEGLRAAVREMRALPAAEKADGILGFGLFAECLLTLDYPGNVVRIAKGALPADGDGVIPFTRERGVPSARITVAGRAFDADIDAGSMGGLSLPEAAAAGLPLAAPPKVVGRGRTASNEFEIKAAPLDGTVILGAVVLDHPMIELQPVFPMANVGSRVLRDLVVTFDQKNGRMRLSRPAR